MFTSLFAQILLAATCQNPKAQCVCYPAVPFEGYQVYVHETCNGQEGSYKYGQQHHDSIEKCQQWIDQDANCQSLVPSL